MSFFSKALRRAEVFLEQVDESVAQASRRLVVEGAVGDVEDSDVSDSAGTEDGSISTRGSKSIPRAKRKSLKRSRSKGSFVSASDTSDGLKNMEEVGHKGHEASADSGAEADNASRRLSSERMRVQKSVDEKGFEIETRRVTEALDDGWGDVDMDFSKKTGEEHDFDSKIAASDTNESSRAQVSVQKVKEAGNSEGTRNSNVRYESKEVVTKGSKPDDHGQMIAPEQANVNLSQGKSSSRVSLRGSKAEARSNVVVEPSAARKGSLASPKPQMALNVSKENVFQKSRDTGQLVSKETHESEKETGEDADDEFVEALEVENDTLREELEAAETELASLKAERSKLMKNLKQVKEVTLELDESLREKSSEARKLQAELNSVKDACATLAAEKENFAREQKKKADKLDTRQRKEIEDLTARLQKAEETCNSLTVVNAEMQEKLTLGRINDAATADDARKEAASALAAYESEVQRHLRTREEAQTREAELENKATLAASALASARRSSEEANVAATQVKTKLRTIESQLKREIEARDAALARIVDLEKELAQAGINQDGEGQEQANKLTQLQVTVQELEHALQAKNVELARLKAECEVMREASAKLKSTSSERSMQVNRTSPEIERQLRSMADEALRKQSVVESLRGENRALVHQLEMERKRTREAQAMAAAQHSIRGGVKGILEVDIERGIREGPMARLRIPRRWPKFVEKALKSLDITTTRILLVLRREPWFRLGLLLYVVGMNVFVYAVLHWHIGISTEEPAHAP